LLLLIFCTTSLYAANNFSAKNTRKSASKPFVTPEQDIPIGEHLIYDVSWMGVPVGTGELRVEKTKLHGRDCYHVTAIAETNEFLSKIYPVHDEVHSWIDGETLQSLQFQKKVSEGFYRANEIVRYDAEKKKGFYESLKNGTKKEFDVSVPIHDILSAFYWVRRQPLVIGKPFKTMVNSDEKDWDLEMDVLRHEAQELRGQGVFDAVLIEPKTRLKGILEKRGRVWIHLNNDKLRVPILIIFKTPFGLVTGVIKKGIIRNPRLT